MLPLRTHHKERLTRIFFSLLVSFAAIFLIMMSSYKNIHIYRSIHDFYQNPIINQRLRIGGIIEKNSLHQDATTWIFKLSQNHESIEIHYQGVLPLLFKENQETLIEGIYDGKVFHGERVLIKHDERYSANRQQGG